MIFGVQLTGTVVGYLYTPTHLKRPAVRSLMSLYYNIYNPAGTQYVNCRVLLPRHTFCTASLPCARHCHTHCIMSVPLSLPSTSIRMSALSSRVSVRVGSYFLKMLPSLPICLGSRGISRIKSKTILKTQLVLPSLS